MWSGTLPVFLAVFLAEIYSSFPGRFEPLEGVQNNARAALGYLIQNVLQLAIDWYVEFRACDKFRQKFPLTVWLFDIIYMGHFLMCYKAMSHIQLELFKFSPTETQNLKKGG